MALSALLERVYQNRQASRPVTPSGIARGSMGVMGSRPYASRNPQAAEDKERRKLRESPLMQAYLAIHQKRLLF